MDINDIKQETDLAAERKVNQLPVTYDSLMSYLNARKNAVIEGYDKGYILASELKNIEETLKQIREEIIPTVLSEIESGYEWNGLKFEPTSGCTYEYKHDATGLCLKRNLMNIKKLCKCH